MSFLPQLRQAISTLNPNEVRAAAEQRVAIHLIAAEAESYTAMASWLLPAGLSPGKRAEASQMIFLAGEENKPANFDLEIYAEDAIAPADAFIFRRDDPKRTVREILNKKEQLGLPLARLFPPFREEVCARIIPRIGAILGNAVASENPAFSIAIF